MIEAQADQGVGDEPLCFDWLSAHLTQTIRAFVHVRQGGIYFAKETFELEIIP